METATIGTPILWLGFTLFILGMLAIDLGIFNRRAHVISVREAILWTGVWVSLALIFNLGVWHWFGADRALEFLTGYLIEKSLSIDNIFIFLVIFSYFSVPSALQHRVLFWGVLGALIMRAAFIGLGAILLKKFSWIIYPFGVLLIWTGLKLLIQKTSEAHPENNFIVRLFKRYVPMIPGYQNAHFIVVQDKKLYATPLLLVLLTIEVTDLIFAVDSIPAIFAITSDPFIIYTSNVFAMLGLRSLYFALSGIIDKFSYLRTGIALVLIFVGSKMLVSGLIKIPILISLIVIITILAVVMVISLLRPKDKEL